MAGSLRVLFFFLRYSVLTVDRLILADVVVVLFGFLGLRFFVRARHSWTGFPMKTTVNI